MARLYNGALTHYKDCAIIDIKV